MRPLLADVLGFAYLASGAFLGIYGLATLARTLASRRWSVVDGEIIESRLKGGYTGETFRWDAVVRYSYTVGGTRYEADRVNFGSPAILGWQRIAERVLARYPLGRRVSVRVSPTNHSLAVLETGPSWFVFTYVIVGAGLVSIGVHRML